MLYALLVALAAINAGYLIHLDRRDKRERDERAELLQRIQAPHAAIAEHHATVTEPEPPDRPFPMSDEEMAAQQERDRMISWMEAVENGRASMLEVPE